MRAAIRFGLMGLAASALAGCVVNETRPLPKLEAVQATQQIAETELLEVGIREFDAGVPEELKDNTEALDKRRVYPEVRKAESRLLAVRLRTTLEASAQWGAVRVVPESVKYVDVLVTARILESTGQYLSLAVTAKDAVGRVWIDHKTYSSDADLGSYKTDAALRARDAFQNIYSSIANDLLAARERLSAAERREVRQVAQLQFARDLDPESFGGYLQKDAGGLERIARLPATDDPARVRVERIRERDMTVIDTLDGYNTGFSEQLFDSYGAFRRTSYEAIEKEERARSQATTRTALGAAAVLASIFVSSQCSSTNYDCRRIEDAVRTAGAIGGTAAVLSGIQKYSDAKNAAQEVKELVTSFESEAAAQVVEVEGRSLKLTGTAEEQYREWRRLLAQIYREERTPEQPAPATSKP
jgi:hypothetical protein